MHPLTTPAPAAPEHRPHRRLRRASPAEVGAIVAIAATAGGLALLTEGRPTGLAGIDEAMRFVFAAGITLAATKARRWTWLVLAGGGAIVVDAPDLRVVGFVGLAFALYGAVVSDARQRTVGAAVAAIAAQALLRGGAVGPHGTTALIGVACTAPLLVSAYRRLHRKGRARARGALLAVGAFLVLGFIGFGVAVLVGRPAMNDAIDKTQRGVEAARRGQQEDAGRAWDDATSSFTTAADAFDAPWARPALVIPVLSQHAQTVSVVASSGRDISRSAAVAARAAPYRDLRSTDGQVNVALIRSMRQPLDDAASALVHAKETIDAVDTEWLASPLAQPLTTYRQNLAKALPEAELASQALAVAPGLLGADGDRHYVIAFGTPAESRFLGGFIGSYGELTVSNGKLTLTHSGRIGDLNRPLDEGRVLSGPPSYLERYGRFFPQRFLQNVSASPDFPTVAQVISELYTKSTNQPIDGAIYVDPYALAAFLEFTGPIRVEGLDQPLTRANAAEFLLTGQYEQFADIEERTDYLASVSRTTFEALTKAKLPGPQKLAETLGPLVEQGRLRFSVREGNEEDLLRRIGLTGDFPTRNDQDFFSLRTSNANPNKIDTYLQRDVTYDATFDPLSGAVTSTATVRLTNNAPAAGLPDYVIGNRDVLTDKPGRPRGSNTMYLSVYSPLQARGATLDGADLPLEAQTEFGFNVYSTFLTVPAGETRELRFTLQGTLRAGPDYHLDVAAQPTVHPDHLTARVRPTGDFRITSAGQPVAAEAEQQRDLERSEAFDYVVSLPG